MTENRPKSLVATAFGGFLIMMGTIMMGILILVSFNRNVDITILMEPQFRTLFILALLIFGICDLVSGIILTLR